MKLPKKVRVGAIDYEVLFPYVFKECDDRSAQHSLTDSKIWVSEVNNDRKRKDQKIKGSFLHELIHAIDNNYLQGELEERQVELLGNCMYALLRTQDLEHIPKMIELAGLEYVIEYPHKFKETREYYSFCDNSTCEIFINEDISYALARVSLFNQVISVLNDSYAIELDTDDIKKLSVGIIDVLDRNKLWKFFIG